MHVYDNNNVNSVPDSDLQDEMIVAAVKEFWEDMHASRLNVSNKQAATALKKPQKKKNVNGNLWNQTITASTLRNN